MMSTRAVSPPGVNSASGLGEVAESKKNSVSSTLKSSIVWSGKHCWEGGGPEDEPEGKRRGWLTTT